MFPRTAGNVLISAGVWVSQGRPPGVSGSIRRVASERKRREAAYKDAVDAVMAYLNDEDAELFNLLDEAAKADALGASYRLTFLAAKCVEELATATGEIPSEILDRLIRQSHH